jgi:signal transduction histidine kinase
VRDIAHERRQNGAVSEAHSRTAAWGAFAASAALLTVSGAMVAGHVPWVELVVWPVVVMASPTVGLLVALRRPRNLVGWVLLVNGLLLALEGFAEGYANFDLVDDRGSLPASRLAALWTEASWPLMFAPLTAVGFLFPDGRLPSPRWRPVAIGAVASFVGLTCVELVAPWNLAEDPPFEAVESPLPVLPEWLANALAYPLVAGVVVGLLAGAWAVRTRFRRARGVERLQLLWLSYAAVLLPLTVIFCIFGGLLVDQGDAAVTAGFAFGMVAIPAAIGIAILRYRLLDIELVLNRTLVYGALTVCVVGAYVAIVGALQGLIDVEGLPGLIAAGLVAVAVQPLRMRLQRRVDRLVYGDRSDPYGALTRLAGRLHETLSPDQVVEAIVDSVAEALRLPYVAIEFEREGMVEVAAAHGAPADRELTRLPLNFQGDTIAQLAIQLPPGRELAGADRRLLEDLAKPAGVAVQAVRLTADLQWSRERLVSAREEERRRLRRDLHDGLGPALAASVLQLDAARRLIAVDPEAAEALLVELRDQTQESIADVRRLVYELRPPALDELGLVQALREQASRLGGDGAIDAPERLPPLPAAVEVAAYRIATEAMTNVVRHAHATRCDVRLSLNGGLVLEVEDDGSGLPPGCRAGVGLHSMRERAAELGGSCTVAGRPGGGTVVRALLPLGVR